MDVDKAIEEEKKFFKEVQRGGLIPILDGIEAKGRGELSALADRLEGRHGLRHARIRLSELKKDKRDLAFFFACILIDGGVMTVDQIMRGRKMDELNEAERKIIRKLRVSDRLLELVDEAETGGLDVEKLLEIHLKKN